MLKNVKKSKIKQWSFFCTSMIAIFALYFPILSLVKERVTERNVINEKAVFDPSILAEIESVSEQNEEIFFSGWMVHLNNREVSVSIILEEASDKKGLVLDAELQPSKDIKKYLDLEEEYDGSSFSASTNRKQIKKESCYEIFLSCTYVDDSGEFRSKIALNKYLHNGKLYNYNPLLFEKPNFVNEEFEKVLDQGNICAYSNELSIWIYEYERSLYWIFDEKHVPALERHPGIPWSIYIHREESVSQEELMHDELGSYLHYGIYLQTSDLFEGVNTNYYVIAKEIPTECPVTWIQTGIWSEKDYWVYKTQFQLFNFKKR